MIKMYRWYRVAKIISDSGRVLGFYGIAIDKRLGRILLFFPDIKDLHYGKDSSLKVKESCCWWVNREALEEVKCNGSL